MKVYSIQPLKVWTILQKKGRVVCDKRKICDSSFKEAYAWYVSQAKKHIKNWKSERPFWVWVDRPDLRSQRFIQDSRRQSEEDYVLLELEVPDEKILLSEFNLWHYVLNNWFLSEKDEEAPENLSKKKLQNSWELCLAIKGRDFSTFDKSVLENPKLQGIIEDISLNQVIKVIPFKMINKHSR